MLSLSARRLLGAASAVLSAGLLMGAADGAWLHRVPAADHARTNPLLATPAEHDSAAASGAQIYSGQCAQCHGTGGQGKGSRPAIVSDRVAAASDGDLFWLMTNGNPWKGMPAWNGLPTKQRWQLVAYLRALNPPPAADAPAPVAAKNPEGRR